MILNLIAYFIAIMILIYAYVIFFVFLGKTIVYIYKETKQLIAQKRGKTKHVRDTFVKQEYLSIIKNNPFLLRSRENKIMFVAIIIANVLFWQYLRTKWVTDEYQHKTAMEYHSLSHMLLSYDMGLLTIFRNPNSIALKPLNLLQDSLINSAKEHLPKDDGEIAMYNYFFKLYPYIKMHHDPNQKDAKRLATMTYEILKDMSTKDIADPHIREYRRYMLYPMAAEYFIFIQWEEYGIEVTNFEQGQLSSIALFNDPVKLKRLEDIGKWTLKHYQEYKKYPKIKAHIEKEQIFEAMYLNAIVAPLREVMDAKIFHLTFRCEDELIPIIYKYVDIYNKKFYGRGVDYKEFWKYSNIIVDKSKDFSNASCALCGYEPIKGTYMTSFKDMMTCYPVENEKDFIPEYRNSDPSTHYKWFYRVRELEKIIKKDIKKGSNHE